MLGLSVTIFALADDVATVVVLVTVGWLLLEHDVDTPQLFTSMLVSLSTLDKADDWEGDTCGGATLVCGLVSVSASIDGFEADIVVVVVVVVIVGE